MESIKKHVKIVALFTVFVFFIAFAITNQTEFPTESNIAANFTVELANAPETISNINPGTIHTEKLKEKPISVKTPHFEPLQYLNIHNYNATNSSITIRLFNEWNRSDLTIYHYAGDDWQPLETRINGSYLEAVTYSFSVFAVGAQGGININLIADDLTFLNNSATIAGAAFYNNSTAAASIVIEINPSWSGYANTTTDAEGNFVQILSGPTQPGNYKVWVNATSGSLNGSKDISINATNATLFRINASASIADTTGPSTNTNISFAFPVEAVPEFANLILNLGSSTNTEVKVNNITIYNGITDNANLNLIGYFDTQNDINITTGTSVTHIYNISFNFHITETATVTQPNYYSAALSVSNDMSYDWNNSNVTFHLPDGAYDVTVWENTTNLTSDTTIPARGGIVGIKDDGIGTIYNNSFRNFYVNYSLEQVTLNVSIENRVAEKLENVYVTPYVYYNGSQIDTITNIKIYRDGGLVEERDEPSGTPFAFSTNIAGVYNISATASPNIDGVVRSGTNHTNLHIKDLLIYLIVDPTHSGKPINVTGRAYYTDCTSACDQTVNLSMDGGSWNTTTNATGHFNYSLPGKTAGSYVINANLTTGNYTASTNATVDVLDEYFYVIKGDLPTVNGEETLSPSATILVNHQNITRASLYIWGKTSVNLTYNPYPYPIIYAEIPDSQYSHLSGTFNIPLYPYDYLEIQSAFLNTTANVSGAPNVDFSFNVTIDDFPIFSDAIGAGEPSYYRSETIDGYIPSILKPGNVQTIRVYKRSANSQQYYFTEEIYVRYIGHVAEPHDLYFKVNNIFTFAKMGDIPNATVDVTGISEESNSILINNDITSIIGYNLNLQKRYFGYTAHSETKLTSRYNVTDTAVFTPEADLTSVTVLIPLMDHAKDVRVFVNDTNVTDSAIVGVNMELPLSEINATKVINVTYWAPILDITPSVNNTQFNRGATAQISANITFNSEDVSGATVYANITKAGIPIANLTLNFISGGMYSADYTLSSSADLGVYDAVVWAYNDSTAITSNDTTFKVRGLNISLNAGGPYVVDNNASITGNVKDLENGSNINGASVNIRIWNSTFSYNTTRTTYTSGNYILSRLVDYAGDYNVTVNVSDANILGSVNTTYRVKYNVSVATSQEWYNKGSSVPVNITVYDSSLSPVSGATVNSTVWNGTAYTYYGDTTDSNGMYNFTHDYTATYNTYNITANVSKAGVIGNATDSFRVSNLTVTVYTQAEYFVDSTVVVNGNVWDDEAGDNAENAYVNVTLDNSSFVANQTNTTNSSGNYSVSFDNLYAGVYTANVDVLHQELTGGATTSFHIHYKVNTTINKTIFAISEAVPINVSVLDVNNIIANANVSINITKPDDSVENLNGTTSNGYFNTSFSNTSLEGDYTISVHALNESTLAHGDAVDRTFRATGFIVNVSLDRSPRLYKLGETVNLSGVMQDTLGAARIADVFIRINSSAGSEVANTTLYNRNGIYAWNNSLSEIAVAGWYTVTVIATTPEGVSNSTVTQFEVQLNMPVNTQLQYNPGDTVNITVLVRNGTAPESHVVNMTVQKFEIWDQFTGTYFDTSKMTATLPDYDPSNYLDLTLDDELIFYTTNLTASTLFGKAVQLNITSLPSHFILDYEVSTSGTSSSLIARPSIGNATNYVRFDIRNYSADADDRYDVNINGVDKYVLKENTNNQKVHLSIEYDSGIFRFYKNGEQVYQTNFALPSDSVIKLNGYAWNSDNGSTAYLKFDNVTLYNLSSPVLNQSTAIGSGGNYSYNFTAGGIGMYRVNATTGNSSEYTTFLVRTLNVTTVVYGPYNFNESSLSPNTVVPLLVHGTVQDTETHADINDSEINITILQSGSPYTYKVTSSTAGNYVINFSEDFDSTAVGLFNVSVSVNDSSIVAVQNNSFTSYTINQSWVDQTMDYRVPILLYFSESGYWHFDEGSGTTAVDMSGYGNNGTLVNSPTWTTGKYGSGITTSGTAYVSIPAIDLGNQWTIETWFLSPIPSPVSGWATLTRGTSDHQILAYEGRDLGTFDNGGTGFHDSGYDINTLTNGWHHLKAVGTAAGNTDYYIDGIYKASSDFRSTSDIVSIGNFQSGGQPFGTIDEVKIYNMSNSGTVSFNLVLPGGFTVSGAKVYDIQGTDQNATIVDLGSYVYVTFPKNLSAYEGKILYLYFERPDPTIPNSSTMNSLSASYSVINGTTEGYAITITPDKISYSAGEKALINLQLKNITGNYIVSNVTTTIYYPNGTAAQVNSSLTNATGQALVNYTLPAVKGTYTVTTNATVNGIPRKESSDFNVGDLIVLISKDKAVYNTLENVSISVNVTENGNITGAEVILKIYDSNNIKVFEQIKNTTALWTQTTNADFNSGTLWNISVGSGNVTLNLSGGNYTLAGSLTSSVYNGGRVVNWGAIRWNGTTPASTNITLYTRTSQDNSTWSNWVQSINGEDIPNSSRYIQYRANLTTSDNTTTPTLRDVTIELAVPVNFTYTLSSSPLGNYTITASASKSGNAGYNNSIFELDQFNINTTTDKAVYTSSGNINDSGSTTYRGGNAIASVNLTIKKNLAVNPSFETDLDNNSQPDGWSPEWQGIKTWDTVSRSGNKSVKITLYPANTTEGGWNYPNMYVISPNTYFTFSTWSKTDSIAGGNMRLWVEWYNGATLLSTATNTIRSIREQDGWVLIQGGATSPSNADNVRIHLVSDIEGNVWFDDVNIEPENNPAIYTANTTSNTLYNFTLSLANASSYIVYANGSYNANGTLTRSNTTIFTVRSLDVNTSAGGPHIQAIGNITISGYVLDNQTQMAVPGTSVTINITYPNSTLKQYTNTTDSQGYYEYTINTPGLFGTYSVNVSAVDKVNVVGTANTTFIVNLRPIITPAKVYINPGENQTLTVEVFNDYNLGTPLTGADVTINITGPDAWIDSYSTSGIITDQNNGTYTLNYSNTSSYGNYTANAIVTSGIYNGTSSNTFGVDGLYVSSEVGGPYIVGDTVTVTGQVGSITRAETLDGNVTINLTYPNGTSVEYSNISLASTESYIQPTDTISQSGFSNVANFIDGSTSTYARTYDCTNDYIGVIWSENKTINRVKASYYNRRWPTAYKIQVLDSNGITWIDKKVVSGYSTSNYPTIEDFIPITQTKGVRIYYQSSNYQGDIYIYEMWAYGLEYSLDLPLPLSGNYTLNVSAEDSYGVNGSAQPLNIPVRFLVSTTFDKVSYEPGDSVTAYIRPFNGTGYEPDVTVSSRIAYASNDSEIDNNVTTTNSTGVASVTYTLPMDYTSYYVNSSLSKDGIVGYGSNVTSSANLRMWMDPAEALVGHSTWPTGVTPIEYRNLTINAAILNSAGNFMDDGTITANVYNYNGALLSSVVLTENDGVFSGIYTVLDNGPEGRYWFEIQEYPGIKQYFNVVEWGCTRCHIDPNMQYEHEYFHSIYAPYTDDNWYSNYQGLERSDGPVYPSNFSKEFVHEVHPTTSVTGTRWGSTYCGYHNNARDWQCVKCHPTEVMPSACPDCHNSANNKGANILTEDYGADIHAGINIDLAQGKSATSSNGGNPDLAVDNDEKTMWEPDGVSNQVIEIDLGGLYPVDGVRIAMGNYKATYTIEANNSVTWDPLISSSYTNYGNDKTYNFTEQNISKIRLTVVSASDRIWNGGTSMCWATGAVVVTQRPQVKSINVYMPNDLPVTAANSTSHIACQSCHGGDIPNDVQPTIPKCTDCHPYASDSGMQVIPESIRGSTKMFEDFEDIDGWQATSGFTGSSVSINTNTTKVNGTYSGQVDYTLGIGYGRINIDKTDLELTNATKISIWVYGDNSDSILTIGLNNNKNSKIDWHWSTPITIDWIGWREVSININELSQRSLMYISGADTVRIKLEKWGGGVDDSTILIDELIAVKVGSHTEFDDVVCGVCHGSMHDLQLSPECNYCHQTQDHGWPTKDKYPGDEAQCMICHEIDVTENLLNVSNISLHADHIEDFENISIFTNQLTNFNLSDNHYSGLHEDSGNHSAVLNYTNLVGYLGNSLNITNGSKYKGISVFVNATSNTNTTLILGVYTDAWYNYTRVIDWTGWKEINVIYHNDTVNETRSFNATGDPTKISFGVNGTNSNGSIYFDDLRQAVSDDYHQYVSWKCTDCHTQTKNLPGITDITSPITDCSLCHNQNEPHFKQFTLICMDCHFESGHGDVDPTFTDYEKASTCLKCHTQIHDFNQTHLESYPCSNCHDLRVHGQNAQLVTYNESIHLTCERCHGKATAEKPLPLTLGNPGSIFLRLSYTYNNETQCNFCHQNRSNAYILHTNLTVNESNIDSINDDTICTSCHDPIPSITNISDRDELTAEDNQREPHAQQILGHGNVSCYKCHGHRPETLTLTIGQDCVGCHQDPTELVELAPGKINKSSLSNVTNPGALQLIVISPQTTGHGNTSCAECHGHTNSNLTSVGSDSTSCTNCHENTSSNVSLIEYRQPNSPRSNITGQVDNTIYVTPPQVVGHGNTSCIECHDHVPSSFLGYSIVGGTDCAICHQNTSTNVTLIGNTIPASANTGVVDNSTSVWIVHAPQVSGHGQADCSICHSHNVENLVYNGGTDNDCITCHYNESSGTYLLQNGSYVVPPQVVPHNDLNCSECHGHTPNSMTHGYGVDCRVCHQNTTKAQSLTDTYGIGLNLTLPAGNISAVQIPALNHSTGVKWNKTTAYWTNDSEACQYCHKISTNYSNHNPLGRVSVIAGNNTKNSSLVDSYWCAACHYENYSSGSVTFDDSVELFLEANLPVPPEVAANTTYGNYTYANDGLTKYYDHSLSDYSDEKCAGCHGESDNTKEFVHHVVGGFASCIGCHDYGDTNSDYRMNNTDMKLSVHANLNSNASNSTGVHADNKKCWGCHTSDGQEPVIDMGDKYTNPYTCMECHNTTSKAYDNVSNAPAVYNHFGSGEVMLKQMGNDTIPCMACHNKDEMKVNFSEDDSFRSNRSVVSHYAMNFTPLSSLRNYTNSTQYCIFCHDNDTSIFNIFVTEKTNHGSNCSVCHGTGRIHDELSDGYTPSLPSGPGGNISGCLGCHADANSTISEIYLLNMTMFNDSVHYLRDGFNCLNCHISDDDHPSKEYKWKWCEDCHVVQNDPINDTDRHNVTNDPFNYTIGGVSVVNITDCTVCHDATAYNASVEAYDTNKCRYCHEYADKGNKTTQSWY